MVTTIIANCCGTTGAISEFSFSDLKILPPPVSIEILANITSMKTCSSTISHSEVDECTGDEC
jgi:hypothetical protein